MLPSLYAIVVNWNLQQDTVICLESLIAAGVPVERIIVVDNGSTDGSVGVLRERFGASLPLIESRENLGFARGNNLGLGYALDHGAHWILLVNNDTHVAPTFLSELTWAVESGEQFAIYSPLILYHDSPNRIWYLGDRLVPGLLFTYSLSRNQNDCAEWPALLPVDFVTGCGMLIRRQVFEKVGLFDPQLFMYAEDVDFCWRARQAGFRLAAAPRAKMWHKVATSSNRDRPMSRYLRMRNQNRFYRVYARGLQLPVMCGLSALRAAFIALTDLARGRQALIRPLARGWIDGWRRPENSEA
jgi:GT2 family glycosyltransferase